MAQEIERKYLVTSDCYKTVAVARYHIRQGYISREKTGTVRIRITDNQAFLTIKGKPATGHFARYEWEKEIPVGEAADLLRICETGIIDKIRHIVEVNGPGWKNTFEIDEFHGGNEGLVFAEIELNNINEEYLRPNYLGREVTGDKHFYNAYISHHPYPTWKDEII